jgi:hypothetical protein
MSLGQVTLLVFLAIGVSFGTATLAHSLTRFRERTLDDVRTVLQEVDIPILEEIFDVEGETKLRLLQGDHLAYRREMRARLDTADEHMGRAAHNALILLQWGSTEYDDMKRWIESYSQFQQQQITALYSEGRDFRRLSLRYTVRNWLFCLWRFDKCRILPVPSIAALRQIGGRDFIDAYKKLVEAAAGLGMIYGKDEANELRSRMWTNCARSSVPQ